MYLNSKIFLLSFFISVTAPLFATELTPAIKFSSDGSFSIGDAKFEIMAYSKNWAPCRNRYWQSLSGSISNKGGILSAVMIVDKTVAQVREKVKVECSDTFSIDFSCRFKQPVMLKSLHGELSIPANTKCIVIDGRKSLISPLAGSQVALSIKRAKTIRVRISAIQILEISSKKGVDLLLQDRRQKEPTMPLKLRLFATPRRGMVQDGELSLKFRLITLSVQTVDISDSTNFGFADEIPGDGKGGWTDQGKNNDLRMIQSKMLYCSEVPFQILDDRKNNGRSILKLAGKSRKYSTKELSVKLPKNNARSILLLHASGWTPKTGVVIGEMQIVYSNGKKEVFEVKSQRDCGNWWNPMAIPNGRVAKRWKNATTDVGLYVSSFNLSEKKPERISFKMRDASSEWLIAAVSLCEAYTYMPIIHNPVFERKTGKSWKVLKYKRQIPDSSLLNFSRFLDAPAGKYGFVTTSIDGALSFANSKTKKALFYGVNLCFSANYLSEPSLQKLADYLVYCGYNAIRLHLHDQDLIDHKAPDSISIDPVKMDKLDHLIYEMKKRGIYIATDLYSTRRFKPGDYIPECLSYSQRQMKFLLPISQAARDNWKSFARRWLTHRNPYTGLTWMEEPALFVLTLANEENLSRNFYKDKATVERYYKPLYKKYLSKHRIKNGGEMLAENPHFLAFLNTLQSKVLDEQLDFLRNNLKVKTLLTSLNVDNKPNLTLLRNKLDIVDNHCYHAHPHSLNHDWKVPMTFNQQSSISRMARIPCLIMPTRIPGKPFIISEFNFCNPNRYRSESGPLMGAYSGLNNCSAVFRFAWTHGSRGVYQLLGAYGFDIAGDPLSQFSDRIGKALLLSDGIKKPKETYVYQVPVDLLEKGGIDKFPPEFRVLATITAIGSIPSDVKIPIACIPLNSQSASSPKFLKNKKLARLWQKALKKQEADSINGQIKLNAKRNSFIVRTSTCESISMENGKLTADILSVQKTGHNFDTVAAISCDNKPLSQSNRILIIHLTEVCNSKLIFGNKEETLVKSSGNLPLLIRHGTAKCSLKTERPYKITALDADGVPRGKVTGNYAGGKFMFHVNSTLYDGGIMAYALVRSTATNPTNNITEN